MLRIRVSRILNSSCGFFTVWPVDRWLVQHVEEPPGFSRLAFEGLVSQIWPVTHEKSRRHRNSHWIQRNSQTPSDDRSDRRSREELEGGHFDHPPNFRWCVTTRVGFYGSDESRINFLFLSASKVPKVRASRRVNELFRGFPTNQRR